MLRKNAAARQRALCALPLFVFFTGVLQFPLSVLGNGFADNQKQLFCFSLCHDLLLGGTLLLLGRRLGALPQEIRANKQKKGRKKRHGKGHDRVRHPARSH